jgi:hypothetical protein
MSLQQIGGDGAGISARGIAQNFAELFANQPVPATIAAAGNGLLTAAAMSGKILTRSGATAVFTDTTDTAANLIAIRPQLAIGQSWPVLIVNTTSYQMTIAAGTGVTLAGASVVAIAANCLAIFALTYTAANAMTMTLLAVIDRGIDNFSATTDPGTANDNTQGYGVGSMWCNLTANRFWQCLSAATGAAIWGFAGAAYGAGGSNPSTEVAQFGGSTAVLAEGGNINRQISAAGVAPGATGADNVIAVFSLPANALDGAAGTNRGISILASGKFGATANNKDIKLWWNPAAAIVGSAIGGGGTLLADTLVVATNGGGWWLSGNVYKYGAANSNTQLCTSNGAISGAVHNGVSAPATATAVENAPILIAVTANCTTATSDALFNFLEIAAAN